MLEGRDLKKRKKIISIIIYILVAFGFLSCILLYKGNYKNLLTDISNVGFHADVSLNCDKNTAAVGDTIHCSINASVSGEMVSFSGKIVLSNGLELTDASYTSSWASQSSAASGNYQLSTPGTVLRGNVKIGDFSVKVVSDTIRNGSISMSNVFVGNSDWKEVSTLVPNFAITVKSNDNLLSNLDVGSSKLSPSFNKNVFNYTINTEDDKITIIASAPVHGSVSGAGEKTLQYGRNVFTITSISETGNRRDYTITVIRIDRRDTNNYLQSLSITPVNISFSPNTFSYTATVSNKVDSVTIKANPASSKAKIIGAGKRNINVGKNILSIVVSAENGDKKTYTIIINRKDKAGVIPNKVTTDVKKEEKSENITQKENDAISNSGKKVYLKNLSVIEYDIHFSKEIFNYSFQVPYTTEKLNINYEAEDIHSKVTVSDTDLSIGSNKITITVEDKYGNKQDYVLDVEREDKYTFNAEPLPRGGKKLTKYLFIRTFIVAFLVLISFLIDKNLKKKNR